jgi:hypothetical protein
MRLAPFVAALAGFVAACSGSSSPNTCVPGASVACTCANGKSGAQVCSSSGTLGACVCEGGTGAGGAGGSSGTGGATGSGGSGGATGAGGTAGTGSGGTAGGETTGHFTIMYDGSLTKTLSTCYSCTASYITATNTGGAAYNFSVDTGITSVAITLRPVASGGWEVAASAGGNNSDVPATLRGTFATTPPYVAVASSCVSFTMLNVAHGGGMAGSLNCTMSGGNDTTPHTAVVQGTFTAAFP